MIRDYNRILPCELLHSARLGIDEDELCEQRDPRNRDQLMIPCGGGGEAFKLVLRVLASTVLFVSGYIPDQREDGEEFLGRNSRPKQTEMLKSLQLTLGHVITRQ